MQYLLLAIVVACISLQNIFRKQYNVKMQTPSAFSFSLLSTVFALLFFVICSGFKLEFVLGVVPYSVGFAVSYALALAGSLLAIKHGPLSITMLITSYSLVIPAFHGIFAYGDTLEVVGIIGLLMLLVSLFLINKKSSNSGMSIKWLFYVILAFGGNGFCSVFQKMQQRAYEGEYKNEFMIISLVFCALFMIAAMVIAKEKPDFKNSLVLGAGCGVANGIVNMLVMVLVGSIPSIILYPSIAAGGIVIGFLVAVFVYKERLSTQQIMGYIMGTISVVLMNL